MKLHLYQMAPGQSAVMSFSFVEEYFWRDVGDKVSLAKATGSQVHFDCFVFEAEPPLFMTQLHKVLDLAEGRDVHMLIRYMGIMSAGETEVHSLWASFFIASQGQVMDGATTVAITEETTLNTLITAMNQGSVKTLTPA